MKDVTQCGGCADEVPAARWQLGYRLCLRCGESKAREERKRWTVLTLHKQGPMHFTAAFGREAAVGANNKGGLVK